MSDDGSDAGTSLRHIRKQVKVILNMLEVLDNEMIKLHNALQNPDAEIPKTIKNRIRNRNISFVRLLGDNANWVSFM
jgi:hypothetical protein